MPSRKPRQTKRKAKKTTPRKPHSANPSFTRADRRKCSIPAHRPAQELNVRAPAALATTAEVEEKKIQKKQTFLLQPQCPLESRGRQNAKRIKQLRDSPHSANPIFPHTDRRKCSIPAHRPAQELNARAPAALTPPRRKARERNFASPATI